MAKEWKTVRFGVEGAYPPFSWTDASGEIKGFDIDLANALDQHPSRFLSLEPVP